MILGHEQRKDHLNGDALFRYKMKCVLLSRCQRMQAVDARTLRNNAKHELAPEIINPSCRLPQLSASDLECFVRIKKHQVQKLRLRKD